MSQNRKIFFGAGTAFLKTIGGVEESYPIGIMQDMELTFNGTLQELFGQGEFAEDIARGEISASGKISYGQRNLAMENAVFLAATINTGGSKIVVEPEKVIIDTTVTDFIGDLGVVWTSGADASKSLTRVSATPSAGEYAVSAAGEYTFNAADITAGESIKISYVQTSATGSSIEMKDKVAGQAPKFQIYWQGVYDGSEMSIALTSCVAESLTILSAKRGEHQIYELPFKVSKDDTGKIGYMHLV